MIVKMISLIFFIFGLLKILFKNVCGMLDLAYINMGAGQTCRNNKNLIHSFTR